MRSVHNAKCAKCGVCKMRCVQSQCGGLKNSQSYMEVAPAAIKGDDYIYVTRIGLAA